MKNLIIILLFALACLEVSGQAANQVDTISVTGASAVNRELYQTPPRYKYYRLRALGSVGDTCIITNTRYYLKY